MRMKNITWISIFLFPLWANSQITLNQIDNFEGFTTSNWTKSTTTIPNENIWTGGPAGQDDNFLRVQSNGGTTSSGKLVTFNNAQWKGNYITAGVTYISMDVRNSGTSVITLRLAFQNIAWTNDPKWSSINPIAVVPGQGWNTIIFPVTANALTKLGHTNSYSGDFNNINELRILHDDAPGWDGDAIEAVLDIDNIQARDNNLAVIDLELLRNDIKLFPNPATHFIKIGGLVEPTGFHIYDFSGRIINSGTTENLKPIDLGSFIPGLYVLKLESGETFKFIKSN